jgi:hypothetical protein
LVFVDNDPDYVNVVGGKNDRLFQIEVGIPDPTSVDYQDSAPFVASLARRLRKAAERCGLPPYIEKQLIAAIDQSAPN